MICPSFRGLPNYRRFYNNEVRAFFINGHTKDPQFGSFDTLGSSIISTRGDITYLDLARNDVSNENSIHSIDLEEPVPNAPTAGRSKTRARCSEGTHWSAKEKEIFFELLSRYSIHRVELISEQLPLKSTVEVLNYYHLLKDELGRLKRRRGGSSSHYHKVKIRMSSNQRPFTHTFRIEKTFKSLISMKEIPIAYEMSDRFVQMEEVQARLVMEKETKLVNDSHKKFVHDMKTYGSNDASDFSGENGLETLINLDHCNIVSKRILQYAQNSTKVSLEDKKHPRLHFPPIVLLEQLVGLYTREVILKLLQSHTNRAWLGAEYPKEFTEKDVYRAVGHDLLGVTYLSARNEKLLFPENVPESGESSLTDDNNCEEEEEVTKNTPLPTIVFEDKDEIIRDTDTPPPLHISQLPHNRPVTELPLETSVNKLVTDVLHEKETAHLEESDIQESRNYEHVILTLLTTYREHDADVLQSMYDIDTAFEMVLEDELAAEAQAQAPDGAVSAGSIAETVNGSQRETSPTADLLVSHGGEVELQQEMVDQFMRLYPAY